MLLYIWLPCSRSTTFFFFSLSQQAAAITFSHGYYGGRHIDIHTETVSHCCIATEIVPVYSATIHCTWLRLLTTPERKLLFICGTSNLFFCLLIILTIIIGAAFNLFYFTTITTVSVSLHPL